MGLLKTDKTNWKYLLIIFILSIFVAGGILWFEKRQEIPFAESPQIKKREKPSQEETAKFREKIAVKSVDELLSAEVQRLEESSGEKYRVESKKEFRIGNNNYLMATFDGEVAFDVFKIYKLDDNQPIDLFEKTEFSIGADLKDIDKDEMPEVVLRISNGGNCWWCIWIEILKIKNKKVEQVKIDLPGRMVPQEVQDLDKDGIMEIIGIDTHWEFYKDVCHACSPYVEIIASLQDGVYRISSNKFPDFYNARIKDIEKKLENPFDEEYYFGDLVSLLLNYIVQGEKEKGFSEFKKYADVYTFESQERKVEIERIKSDLNKWIIEEGVDQLTGKSLREE